MLLCFYKDLLTHWGAAVSANPQWVFYLATLTTMMALQVDSGPEVGLVGSNRAEIVPDSCKNNSSIRYWLSD